MSKSLLKALSFAIALAGMGILCTYILSMQVKDNLKGKSYASVEAIAGQVSVHLQDEIDLVISNLQALQSFYISSPQVSPEGFEVFTEGVLSHTNDHIHALEWIPKVSADEREVLERSIQTRHPEFRITERNSSGDLVVSAEKDYYYPVTFVAPYGPNRTAHGFDLNSNATRRASLNFSRDSGELATTAPIRLVQETSESYGFLVFAPVYNRTLTPGDDASQYERALRGFVLGVFRVNSLMDNARSQADQENLLLTLVDSNQYDGGLLYGEKNTDPDFRFNLDIPNRQWQLQVSLSPALRESINTQPVVNWMLAGGIAVSLLLGFSVYALQHLVAGTHQIRSLNQQIQAHNTTLEATVAERTEALAQKNQSLSDYIDELTTQRRIMSSLMEDSQAAKAEVELRAEELMRSNRDLDDFAYVASHDLKAPLRGIDQLASWVAEDIAEGDMAEVPENLSLMRQRVQRLERLLSDLLAYSRVGREKAALAEVDTRLLIDDLFALNSPPPGFSLSVHGDLPVLSTAAVPFEQVIRNLLSNAVKHHDRQNGHITVSCQEEGEYYHFAIQDDGPGIDPDHHEQIFKMFKTLKPRDETEGSGMGLALIKKIVEYYTGSVYLESALGQGTTFYVAWPKQW